MTTFLAVCGGTLIAAAALLIMLICLGATPVDNGREKE